MNVYKIPVIVMLSHIQNVVDKRKDLLLFFFLSALFKCLANGYTITVNSTHHVFFKPNKK